MRRRRAGAGATGVARGVVLAGLLGAGLAAGPGPAGAQPLAYSAEAIHGWVVDAETKAPLEGVHVVAQWILQTGLFDGRRVVRLHVLEAVTDAQGAYQLPAWGPKLRPPFSSLDTADPRLTFFKPGYKNLSRSNQAPHDGAVRTSRWDGKTIPLQRFSGSPEKWADLLRVVQIGLAWGGLRDDLPGRVNEYWRDMPRIVLAIAAQREQLPAALRREVLALDAWETTADRVRELIEKRGAQ